MTPQLLQRPPGGFLVSSKPVARLLPQASAPSAAGIWTVSCHALCCLLKNSATRRDTESVPMSRQPALRQSFCPLLCASAQLVIEWFGLEGSLGSHLAQPLLSASTCSCCCTSTTSGATRVGEEHTGVPHKRSNRYLAPSPCNSLAGASPAAPLVTVHCHHTQPFATRAAVALLYVPDRLLVPAKGEGSKV